MDERSIVITGAFGALGQVVAAVFASQGDRVARTDFSALAPKPIERGIDLAGVDLTDAGAVDAAVQSVLEEFGGIDVLINIAGGFAWETVESGDPATWQRMFATNLFSNLMISKAALGALKRSSAGRIINIGASAAVQAAAGMGAYAASKAGVHRLTEALACELAGSTVTVNAILLSIIDTPANRADMPDADTSQWVQPQAIADVILFLASRAARSITGALIPVTLGQPN